MPSIAPSVKTAALLFWFCIAAPQAHTQTMQVNGVFEFTAPFHQQKPKLRVCLVKEKSNEQFQESVSSNDGSSEAKLCTLSTDGTFSLQNPNSSKFKYIAVVPAYHYKKLHEPNLLFFFPVKKKDTMHIVLDKLPAERKFDRGNPPMAEKPVVYLYPKQRQQVEVKLQVQGKITSTYPDYQNGWSVVAQPDGTLQNIATGRLHPYLFWEASIPFPTSHYQYREGFCVEGKNTLIFLEQTLDQIGLSAREATDFISYWLPRMQHNAYNLVHFWVNDNYDNTSFLNVTPKPDSELRIMMEFAALDAAVNISPQVFKPFVRKGFSVVEWGGVEVKDRAGIF